MIFDAGNIFVASLGKAFALTCVFLLSVFASATQKCGSLDRVMIAIRLTGALHPELQVRELSISFSLGYPSGGPISFPTDGRTVGIALDKPQWPSPGKADGQSSVASQSLLVQNHPVELPLYLSFDFLDMDSPGRDVVCRPTKFMKGGNDSRQMTEAKEIINTHPEWTDAQDVNAMRQYGLRFGPDKKAALLRHIPLQKLSEFYGPLRIKDVRFSVADIKQPGSSFADLTWYIDAKEVGTPRLVQIMVEPFNGTIVGISEYHPPR